MDLMDGMDSMDPVPAEKRRAESRKQKREKPAKGAAPDTRISAFRFQLSVFLPLRMFAG
jgi:hypothetical protein